MPTAEAKKAEDAIDDTRRIRGRRFAPADWHATTDHQVSVTLQVLDRPSLSLSSKYFSRG